MIPGIILTSEFETGGNMNFGKYVEYMDRPDAINFEKYTDYMSNEEKSDGLFTLTSDKLLKAEKKELKEQFKLAAKNGSVMEKLVFSFTDEWLIEHGIKSENIVRTELLQEYTRKAITSLQKSEQGLENFIWCASMHHNTDNLHIHIAMAELHPSWQEGKGRCMMINNRLQQRGLITESSLKKCKSTFTNQVIRSSEKNNEINEIIRKRIIVKENIKNSIANYADIKIMFDDLILKLPKNMSLWKYNMNAMAGFRDDIDTISDYILKTSCKSEYEALETKLDELSDLYRKSYGISKEEEQENFLNFRSEDDEITDFKTNKINDLYQKLGNSILKECIEYSKTKSVEKLAGSNAVNIAIDEQKIKPMYENFGSVLQKSIGNITKELPETDDNKIEAKILSEEMKISKEATKNEESAESIPEAEIKPSDEKNSYENYIRHYHRDYANELIGNIKRLNSIFKKDIDSIKNQAIYEYNERMEELNKKISQKKGNER